MKLQGVINTIKRHHFVNHLENEKLRRQASFVHLFSPILTIYYMSRHCVKIWEYNGKYYKQELGLHGVYILLGKQPLNLKYTV